MEDCIQKYTCDGMHAAILKMNFFVIVWVYSTEVKIK